MAIDPSKLMPEEDFLRRMEDYKTMVKSAKAAPGAEILLPGELEYRSQLKVAKDGLELDDAVLSELIGFAK